jgi:hypothetical protein
MQGSPRLFPATFDEARADFEYAWRMFLSKRTDADFQALARSARLDREEIRAVGRGREVAFAKAQLDDALSLRRDV